MTKSVKLSIVTVADRRNPIFCSTRGAILFICLWALVVLSIFTIGIGSRVSAEMRLAKFLKERIISLYLAKAALNQAEVELKKDETPESDTIYEVQRERKAQLGLGDLNYKFIDEEGLININSVPSYILERLPGLSSELAKKIIESDLRPFALKEELLLVEGITKEIFLQFKDLVTVYGSGRVNVNTASEEVFKISGLTEATIETILAYRRGEDGEEITEDDRAYTFLPADVPANLFTTTSSYLRLAVSTKVLNKPVMNYNIVLTQPTVRIKFWQEK